MNRPPLASALKVVSEPAGLEPPVPLEQEPLWAELTLDPGETYRLSFRLLLDEAEQSRKVAFLFRSASDDEAPRNTLGSFSRDIGRFRYPPPLDELGLTTFKIEAPPDGRLKVGVRAFRNTAPAMVSPAVVVEKIDEPIAVAMSAPEAELLSSLLERASVYLEFGSGGSTAMAARSDVQIYSVEADVRWIEKLRREPVISQAEADQRLEFVFADIGEIGAFSMPKIREPAAQWSTYYFDVWSKLKAQPDLILVDGRFRVACAAASLLACPQALVAIHDFGTDDVRRAGYARIHEIAETVEQVERLIVLRRRKDVVPLAAMALMAQSRNDFM